MSSQNCHNCKNPLLRDGTSQPQRFFPELDPDYVKIDERSIMDLIVFMLRQSEKIRFWELDNVTTGNWIGFIENDIATLQSIVSTKNFVKERAKFTDALSVFNATLDPDDFQKLIFLSVDLAQETDGWYAKSLSGYSFQTDIIKIIQSQAAPNIRILASYHLGAQTLSIPPVIPVYPTPFSSLSSIWGDFTTVVSDNSIYTGINDTEKMQSASVIIAAIFESMVNAQEKLSISAHKYFNEIIENYPEHQPHFALLLTFCRLFEYAQNFQNTLTQKHLDFYYKDVLRMEEKPAVPDKVHLVFEPAKNVIDHLIEKGTLFKAGKDDLGKDILFGTDRDVIINQAKVESVKNVFIHKNTDENTDYLFAAPVANSIEGIGIQPSTNGWKLFGEHQKTSADQNLDKRSMPDANIGFAIASPELFLKEGERTIEFDLHFITDTLNTFLSYFSTISDAETALFNNLKVYFSGEEGWIESGSSPVKDIIINPVENSIKIIAELLVEQPAIVPYNRDVLIDPIITEWPVAKIILSQKESSVVYQSMQHLKITGYTISVDVKEAVSLVVANDNGTLDPSKPFFPFGSSPEIGANFYIGSSEIFSRKLTHLSLTLDWQNVPSSDMPAYYNEYRKSNNSKYITANKDFTAKIKFLDNYRWWDLMQETKTVVVQQAQATVNDNFDLAADTSVSTSTSTSSTTTTSFSLFLLFAFLFRFSPSTKVNRIELFNHVPGTDPRFPKTITITNDDLAIIPTTTSSVVVDQTFQLLSYGYKRDVYLQKENIAEYTNNTKRGFIKLELNSPGFLFDVYPKIQTKQAIALSKFTPPASATNVEPLLPNAPYLPTIKLLGIDYKSEHTVDYSLPEFKNFDQRVEQLFQVGPFGVAEIFPVISTEVVTEKNEPIYTSDNLFVQFIKGNELTAVGEIPEELNLSQGSLYIGLKDLDPPRSLTLFFQMDEGTENPDADTPQVSWSYLVNNEWRDFDAQQIISDTTNGLINSGIIEFAIPSEITKNNTILTEGLHWLRVQVFNSTDAFSNVLMLKAQAVSATYLEHGNSPDRLRKLIPAQTISKFVKKDFAIKTTEQPFPSFDGRIKEQSNEFYARAAERLRHKNRAITVRDYEHLVLESFPEIYKVKSINHTSKISENAPGNVSIITVLDPKLRNDKNPFELKVSKSDLESIKRFLQNLNSQFVELDVRNPRYEKIRTVFNVSFKKEFSDETFYRNKLSDDIRRFLSPWAYGEDKEIIFGGRIEKSVILNFIEERPYVDFVTDFQIQQYINNEIIDITGGIEEAVATTASSILITHETHKINNVIC